MANTYGVVAVRTIAFVYGVISTFGGVAAFVLFARIPSDLLYRIPPGLGRAILGVAPWLVVQGTGQRSGAELMGVWLVSLAFVGFGLWSLHRALFGSADSLSGLMRRGVRNDGD